MSDTTSEVSTSEATTEEVPSTPTPTAEDLHKATDEKVRRRQKQQYVKSLRRMTKEDLIGIILDKNEQARSFVQVIDGLGQDIADAQTTLAKRTVQFEAATKIGLDKIAELNQVKADLTTAEMDNKQLDRIIQNLYRTIEDERSRYSHRVMALSGDNDRLRTSLYRSEAVSEVLGLIFLARRDGFDVQRKLEYFEKGCRLMQYNFEDLSETFTQAMVPANNVLFPLIAKSIVHDKKTGEKNVRSAADELVDVLAQAGFTAVKVSAKPTE